jgi:hypothetical protein
MDCSKIRGFRQKIAIIAMIAGIARIENQQLVISGDYRFVAISNLAFSRETMQAGHPFNFGNYQFWQLRRSSPICQPVTASLARSLPKDSSTMQFLRMGSSGLRSLAGCLGAFLPGAFSFPF